MVGGVKSSVILETQALFLFLLPYYWSDGFALLMTTKGCSSRHHLTLQHPGVGGHLSRRQISHPVSANTE